LIILTAKGLFAYNTISKVLSLASSGITKIVYMV